MRSAFTTQHQTLPAVPALLPTWPLVPVNLMSRCPKEDFWSVAEFKVEIQDTLFAPTRLQPDSIALKHAQPDQIKTIAYLLAQTVALHFYEM